MCAICADLHMDPCLLGSDAILHQYILKAQGNCAAMQEKKHLLDVIDCVLQSRYWEAETLHVSGTIG